MKIIANNYEPKDIIRIIREWSGLSQKDFGKTVNCSQSTILSYELGRRNYNIQTLMHIAKVHGITITLEKKD